MAAQPTMVYRRADGDVQHAHMHEGVKLEYQIIELELSAPLPEGWYGPPAAAAAAVKPADKLAKKKPPAADDHGP